MKIVVAVQKLDISARPGSQISGGKVPVGQAPPFQHGLQAQGKSGRGFHQKRDQVVSLYAIGIDQKNGKISF